METLNNFIIEKLKLSRNTKFRDLDNWSIKTAEDGDIITGYGLIYFIYKCLNDNHKYSNTSERSIIYHVLYIDDDREILNIGPDVGVGSINNPGNYRLATEEECEKLFKALKKKGYKWNENQLKIVKI